jgi:hypothetical protein
MSQGRLGGLIIIIKRRALQDALRAPRVPLALIASVMRRALQDAPRAPRVPFKIFSNAHLMKNTCINQKNTVDTVHQDFYVETQCGRKPHNIFFMFFCKHQLTIYNYLTGTHLSQLRTPILSGTNLSQMRTPILSCTNLSK